MTENFRHRVLFALYLALFSGGTIFAQEQPEQPELLPAQFVQPIGTPGLSRGTFMSEGSELANVSPVPDPPQPQVRIQVRVPGAVGPGKDLPYRITVSNTASAEAYRVRVRNPIPEGVAGISKVEPAPDNFDPKTAQGMPKDLIWNIGTLRGGESRTIELTLRPAANAKEVRNQAYVSCEYGQAVTTRVEGPKLIVRKAAPQEAVSSRPITVRVEVTNRGRVPIGKTQLVEDVSKGFEFAQGSDGEKGSSPQQRIFDLGTLRPGQQRIIEYKLTTKQTEGELMTQSVVRSPDVADPEQAESTTKLVTPSLKVDMKAPVSVEPGDTALYEVELTNNGSMPLIDVRVMAALPNDVTVTRMTNGGQRYRNQLAWAIPNREEGPLKPGESYSLRFGLRSNTGGKKTVRVTADHAWGIEESREAVSQFQAAAVLSWQAELDQPTLRVGREGLLTVRIRNTGGDPSRNTRLRVEIPPGIRMVEATPKRFQAGAGEIAFDAVDIPPNGSETFTMTFRGQASGPAWFHIKLYSDALGNQPLRKEKEVQVVGGD